MWNYPNRLVCTVLAEMRDTTKTLNHFTLFRYKKFLPLLIEEAQTMVNRMEAGLEDLSDLKDMRSKKKKLRKEIKKLKEERDALKGDEDSNPHKGIPFTSTEDL